MTFNPNAQNFQPSNLHLKPRWTDEDRAEALGAKGWRDFSMLEWKLSFGAWGI